MTTVAIAEYYGGTPTTICNILELQGIPRRSRKREEVWEQAEQIGDMYVDQEMTTYKIADHFDTSTIVIIGILDSLGIPRRPSGWHLIGVPSQHRHEAWDSAQQIADMYVEQEMSTIAIGERFGADYNIICDILELQGIPRRTNKKEEVWEQAAAIANMYVDQEMTTAVIAEHFGVHLSTICDILEFLGIPRRTGKKEVIWEQAEQIGDMYVDQEMTTYKIAECFDINAITICRILKSLGIPRRTKKREKLWEQSEQIADMYTQHGMSTYEIAEYLDTNSTTIGSILKLLGVPRRTCWQSRRLRLERERRKWQLHFDFGDKKPTDD